MKKIIAEYFSIVAFCFTSDVVLIFVIFPLSVSMNDELFWIDSFDTHNESKK
jgi:hypothetical protein